MAAEAERNPEDQSEDGVSVEFARANLGSLLIDAGVANKRIVIKRHGKPVAAIVGLRDLEALGAPASATATVNE